jgi:1-deoxy-D-xylulose-5-phosphate reductoisomerase
MGDVLKLILTASGGPFRGATPERLKNVCWAEASAHPTWNMGPKISVDSATLMNKALEIIEAHYLFGVPGKDIEVLIHPQSVIHSMVEFGDGSALAQLSVPDMRFPIQYAFTYPRKLAGGLPPLDLSKVATFTFEKPDRELFPSLDFAYEALEAGGTMPAVLNAANEVAVERFRRGEIAFTEIWDLIENAMSQHKTLERPSLDAILNADSWARDTASSI